MRSAVQTDHLRRLVMAVLSASAAWVAARALRCLRQWAAAGESELF
jgi:hypothetical protein